MTGVSQATLNEGLDWWPPTAALGRAARARALTQFGIEHCADRYHALYQRILPDAV